MNITDSQSEYVNELTQKLQNAGIRVKADLRNEKIGFKIREHTLRRVPYMLVCGTKRRSRQSCRAHPSWQRLGQPGRK
ncbi:His/Gly/Thr/Pro-type tRNA ligase C-terminal domain-containing protein [Shigella flexneri]